MATKDELKEYIKGRVKTNTNKEITGNSLQTVLCRMVDELDLNDSCQVVLIRYTNGPTTFGDLKKLYDANKAVVVQFGEGYNILITQVSSTAFTGYRFNLNSGSTDEGGLGIVSMTATRYTFTEEGLTLDNFTVSSNGGSGGDQPASLTWAYSDYEGEGTPPDPDTNPSLWYAAKKDSSVWAALKEEGGAWNIWRLKPYTGKDGRGIKTTQVSYVLSDQGITPPTTGWNINMPNIEVGKYLWSRTIITYTDDTTSTIYSVTYIGKDGNDGKNGTSVTIKGTLESIDDLPTDPKPTPGDGYIINGNLWTYTGTTLENDENHRGFTNVGPIKGDQGNSACLHIAWTNSLAPDWTNFTTQKPSGQKFKYMGTYVDYSADPSTCVDSQNPTDYHWQDVSGENGESVIVADLDNEIESIALDYEGKTTEALAFTPVVSMWYGLTKLTLDSLTAKVVGSIYYRNVTTNPDVSTGTVTVGLRGGILITSFQVEITAKATVRGQSYIKQVVFSVNCVKAGAPGEDATLYSLQPSVSAIHKDKNGNIDPVSITCKKLKTVGSTQGDTQDGVLKYKIDNGSLLNYSGAIDCSLISSKIRFEYSVGGVLWDAEDVFVIRDGKDGDGESAIYADLDNEMIAAQVDYDGVTTLQQTWSTKFSIWSGTAKQTLTSLTVNSPDPLTSSVDKSTGVVTVQAAKGVTLQTKYEIEITGTAVVNGETLTRKATLVLICPRPGQPGEDTLIYQVKPSETVISKHKDGTYSANSITCQVIVIQGSESAIADLTALRNAYIYYYTDGSSTKKTYSRALVPGTDFTSSVKFQFVIDNFLWDTETVLIIEDGKDGKDGNDGDTPYIVDSKTKTEYAITTNTEIPTSWSPTPIEGIPGQYLWIRITYTWSNGSTTVSLSYSRCGSDGSSGTSKATVVNYQGPWKADGLYTGMEDDTTIRVDVVYYQGTGESDGKYYLAIQSKQFIDQTTPAPNTAEGKAYWGAFQGQFANIATGLLFTETAVIENAIVRVLQTASEGARIETVRNELVSYDKTGVQRVILSPEENISISESDYDTSTNVELVTLAFSVNNMNTGGETYQAKIDSQAYTHELIQMQEAGEIWETKILDEQVGYALLGKYTQISSTGSDIDRYQFEPRPCIISGFTKEYSKYFSGIGTIPGANMLEIQVIPDYDMNSPNFTTRYELIARRCFKEGQVERFEEYTLINKTLSTYLSYFELGGTSNIVSKLTKFETGQSDSDDLSIPELKAGVYKFYLRLWIEPKDVSSIEVDDRYGSTVKVKFVNEKNYADEEEVGTTLNAYPVLLYTSSVGKGLYLTSDTFLFMQSRKRYFQLRRYKQATSSGEKYERFSVEAMVDNNFLKLGSNEGFQIETQETFNLSEGFLRYPNVLILKSAYVRSNLAKVLKDFATIRRFPKAQYLPLFLETDGYGRVPLHLLSDSSAVAYACGYAANVNETTVVQYSINSNGLTTKTAKVQQVRTYSYNTLNAAAYTEIRDLVQNGYTVYINGYYSDSDWSGVYFSARVCCYGRMTSSGGVIPQNSYYILAQDFIGYPNDSFNTKDYTIKIYLTSTGTKGMKVNSI